MAVYRIVNNSPFNNYLLQVQKPNLNWETVLTKNKEEEIIQTANLVKQYATVYDFGGYQM